MSVLELMKSRYSVRGFQERPVAREAVLAVLDAARFAPSACNNQPWHFIVVQEPARRAALAACYPADEARPGERHAVRQPLAQTVHWETFAPGTPAGR